MEGCELMEHLLSLRVEAIAGAVRQLEEIKGIHVQSTNTLKSMDIVVGEQIFFLMKPQIIATIDECTLPFYFYVFKFLLHH